MSAPEMQSRNPKQTRKGGPKSRLGCPTCKIRRVKCDESRPYCKRCLNSGRQCEGFADEPAPQAHIQFAPPSLISSFSSPTETLLSEKESQHLNVFRHVFVAGIAGCHKTSGWTSLILQAMHEEPAVRHAAIAFTALQLPDHDGTLQASPNLVQHFALLQYGKSVKTFQKLLDKHDSRSINAALVCSILCTSFEVLEGSYVQAQQHLENGLQLLSSIDAHLVDRDIAQAFARLDVQAAAYVGRRAPAIASTVPRRNPAVFVHFDDAEACLYEQLSDIWSFLRNLADDYRYREPDSIPLHLLAQAQTIQLRLEQWKTMFKSLIEGAQTKMSSREGQQARLLQIHHNTATIMMIGSLHAEEMVYDSCDEMFEQIVSLSTEFHYYSFASLSVKIFSIDMGVILPLFVTATKCRIVRVRKQAIQLLQLVPHCEGVWNAQLMANIAWQVKSLEEDGLDESFLTTQRAPEFRRVHSVDMNVDPKARRAGITFRLRPNGMDGEWEDRESFVTW